MAEWVGGVHRSKIRSSLVGKRHLLGGGATAEIKDHTIHHNIPMWIALKIVLIGQTSAGEIHIYLHPQAPIEASRHKKDIAAQTQSIVERYVPIQYVVVNGRSVGRIVHLYHTACNHPNQWTGGWKATLTVSHRRYIIALVCGTRAVGALASAVGGYTQASGQVKVILGYKCHILRNRTLDEQIAR